MTQIDHNDTENINGTKNQNENYHTNQTDKEVNEPQNVSKFSNYDPQSMLSEKTVLIEQ